MKQLDSVKRYSGRPFAADDIERIRQLIQKHPEANRQRISYLVCEAMDWRKSDGGLKDMSCRVALLRMYREGLIELPTPRHKVIPCRSFSRRTAQAEPELLFESVVHELKDLWLKQVERKDSALWNEYIDRYHYLGYKPLPGAQLRYIAYAGDRVLGGCPRIGKITHRHRQSNASNLKNIAPNHVFIIIKSIGYDIISAWKIPQTTRYQLPSKQARLNSTRVYCFRATYLTFCQKITNVISTRICSSSLIHPPWKANTATKVNTLSTQSYWYPYSSMPTVVAFSVRDK